MEAEPIIVVKPNGEVSIGAGYNIGQVLEAIEITRRIVLGVVLRPAEQQEPQEAV